MLIFHRMDKLPALRPYINAVLFMSYVNVILLTDKKSDDSF